MRDKNEFDIYLKGGTKATFVIYCNWRSTYAVKGWSALRYELVSLEQDGKRPSAAAQARLDAWQAERNVQAEAAGEGERYAKKVTLYAKLPSGVIVDRVTDHPYAFVVAVKHRPDDENGRWGFVRWSKTAKAAQAAVRQFQGWSCWERVVLVPVFRTRAEAEAAQV